jgi:hypothetical protein
MITSTSSDSSTSNTPDRFKGCEKDCCRCGLEAAKLSELLGGTRSPKAFTYFHIVRSHVVVASFIVVSFTQFYDFSIRQIFPRQVAGVKARRKNPLTNENRQDCGAGIRQKKSEGYRSGPPTLNSTHFPACAAHRLSIGSFVIVGLVLLLKSVLPINGS